jgi:pimeloyl-ACP methyl ester carboxylesterase
VTVVLVHCYALDLRVWDPVCAALDDAEVAVVRFDLRGHGASDPAATGIGVPDLGDDLAALIAEVVPDGPVVLAGHSLGGMVVMAMADRHPDLVADRVAGVALLATSSGDMAAMTLGLPGPLARGVRWAERAGMAALAAAGAARIPCPGPLMDVLTRWLGFGEGARPADVTAVAGLAAECRIGGVHGLRRAIDEHDCRCALITFDGIPTVVAVGDRDRVTPVRHAAVIAQWLPGARLVVHPGAGHMLPVERAGEIALLVEGLAADAAARPTGAGARLTAA